MSILVFNILLLKYDKLLMQTFCRLSWIKTHLETLGIFITNDPDDNYLLNYKPQLAELKNLLNIWKQRALSLKEKITIINTLALALLIYVASIIDIPKYAITEINNIIQHFIWDGKTSKLSTY